MSDALHVLFIAQCNLFPFRCSLPSLERVDDVVRVKKTVLNFIEGVSN